MFCQYQLIDVVHTYRSIYERTNDRKMENENQIIIINNTNEVGESNPKSKQSKQSKPKCDKQSKPKCDKQPETEGTEDKKTAARRRSKIIVTHLDKLQVQEEVKELQEEEEEVKPVLILAAIAKKKRAPRGPSAKKLAAIASAIVAESEVVSMVADMKSVFAERITTDPTQDTTATREQEQEQEQEQAQEPEAITETNELCEDPYEPFTDDDDDSISIGVGDFTDEIIEAMRLGVDDDCVATPITTDTVTATPTPTPIPTPIPTPTPTPTATTQKKTGRVFRHEFCPPVFDKLKKFTSDHNHLDRKAHKLAWKQWVSETENSEMIAEESKRLHTVGYTGDVLDKMFKACRYYVAKRMSPVPAPTATAATGPATSPATSPISVQADYISDETETDAETDAETTSTTTVTVTNPTKKQKVTTHRTYIPIQKSVLQAMDEHIIMMVLNADTDAGEVKPSTCYSEFCSRFSELIADETTRLIRAHLDAHLDPATTAKPARVTSAADKLKATYKNRMFLIKRNH